jgi:hypothetical protein
LANTWKGKEDPNASKEASSQGEKDFGQEASQKEIIKNHSENEKLLQQELFVFCFG